MGSRDCRVERILYLKTARENPYCLKMRCNQYGDSRRHADFDALKICKQSCFVLKPNNCGEMPSWQVSQRVHPPFNLLDITLRSCHALRVVTCDL